jgi:light-regulated signal transduction histidine kinase (bacteriophytochrome)
MSGLVAGMLRLSRTDRHQLHGEPLALDRLAGDLVQHLRNADPDRRIEVRIAGALDATGDRALVTGLLQNLLENAFKFTRRHAAAVIEVGRELTDRGPSFFVRDNGVGFDPRHADRLFMPFQRLHVEGEFEGTGIGLSLVKRIAERHGGEVWAVSEPGAGTTIYFTLAPHPR